MSSFFRIGLMLIVAAYCLVCLVVLESRNRAVAGGVLQQFHREYADGGSRKWRFGRNPDSDPRMPVYRFIKGFGLSVYLVAIMGILVSAFYYFRKSSPRVSIATLVACSVVLIRFVHLGVFTAVTGSW